MSAMLLLGIELCMLIINMCVYMCVRIVMHESKTRGRHFAQLHSDNGVDSILSIPIPHQIYQFNFNSKCINFNSIFTESFLPTTFYHEQVLQIPTWNTYSE